MKDHSFTMNRFFLCFAILFIRIPALPSSRVRNRTTSEQDIETINRCQKRWKAGFTSISELDDTDIKKRCGLKRRRHDPNHHDRKVEGGRFKPDPLERIKLKVKDIPQEFDARKRWPKCASIRLVPDQGNCGCCWAVAAATSFADRVCVASGQTKNRLLSAEELLTCCWDCSEDDGCKGGYLDSAFQYIEERGLVSGGGYHSDVGCKPYSVPPCIKGDCGDLATAGDCHRKCTNSHYRRPYRRDKVYSERTIHMGENETLTQLLLMNTGSVVATMAMYPDFRLYTEGIYQRTKSSDDDLIGYHAVRVIGWGTEDGVDYWLVVNSWNILWGEDGLFRIDRKNSNITFGDFVTSIPDL